jgi:hypothetical protein
VRSFHTWNQNTKWQGRQSQSEAADTTVEHVGLMHRENKDCYNRFTNDQTG